MNKKILVVLFLLLPLAVAIPQNMNINGRLTDSGGVPLSGNYQITFKIYNVASGGTALWTSTNQPVTTDSDGIFTATLANVNLNFSDNYYLGLAVGADSEMTPRINLTSSPYAYRAQNISVGGIEFDSGMNAGSQNVTTTGWFNGIFNWLVGSTKYTTFNGTTLNFNETQLNLTIDSRAGGLGTFVPYVGASSNVQIGNNNFSVNSSTLFVNTNTGNVGIGTTNPGALLQVGTGFKLSSDGVLNWGQYASAGMLSWDTSKAIIGAMANNDLYLYAGGNPRMVIERTNGNVGIGTTAPNGKLEVNGTVNITRGSSGQLCFADGTCMSTAATGSSSASAGWTNTSTTTNTALNVNITTGNLTIKTALVYVDGSGNMVFKV